MTRAEMEKRSLPSQQLPIWKSGWGVRYTQTLLFFICLSVVYSLRLNLSLAVVAMATSSTKRITFDSTDRAMVLSSFFWGYGFLQTFLGNLGRKRSSIKVISWCILISSTLSLATPFCAIHFGAYGIIILRMLMGLVQGGIYPNINNLLAMWAVPQEKDSISLFIYNGAGFGTFIAMITSGFLAEHFDWPSIFYGTGTTGIIVGLLCLYYGRCSPEEHDGISKEEKEFMKNSFGDRCIENIRLLAVPWRKILTSKPMLVLTFTHWANSWSNWTVSTLTPLYMNGVLGFDVQSDGFLSALSPATSMILGLFFTYLSIYIRKRNLASVTFTRFMWNCVGMYGPSFSLIALSSEKNKELAIALITAANGLNVGVNLGLMSNHTDLSPNFAGVLYAFTNTVANTASLFGPLISTFIIADTSNLSEWKLAFLLASCISFIGNTVFIFWGTTKKQDWDTGASIQQGA